MGFLFFEFPIFDLWNHLFIIILWSGVHSSGSDSPFSDQPGILRGWMS